jgi:hypothetical protein
MSSFPTSSHLPLPRILVIVPILALCLALSFSFFGFDFTDEGFYLNSFKYFSDYPAVISLFGYIYSAPFRLLGQSVVGIRVFNILSLYLSGYLLILCSTRAVPSALPFSQADRCLVFVPFLASFSLLGLGLFSTPSYNHLALIGCMLVASSLYIVSPVQSNQEPNSKLFVLCLTSGLLLSFLGKPTTYLALLPVVSLFLLSCNRPIRRLTLFSLLLSALFLIIVSSLALGGPKETLSKLSFGKQAVSILGQGHGLQGLATSILEVFELPGAIPLLFIISIQLILFYVISRQNRGALSVSATFIISILFVSVLVFYILSFIFTRPDRMTLALPQFWLVALPVSAILLWFLICMQQRFEAWNSSFQPFLLFLAILLIPLCYGFGTNTGIWAKALSASIIYVSLAVFWLTHMSSQRSAAYFRPFIVIALMGIFLAAPTFLAHYALPQRQPQPLWKNRFTTSIGGPNSIIVLDNSFSEYINVFKTALNQSGFNAGDPILDLTGQSPGLIFAAGGKAIGNPWIMRGGSPKPFEFASFIIRMIPASSLESAWILDEPNGPLRIDPSILNEFGINLEDGSTYEQISSFDVPGGAGGYFEPRSQVLYKPLIRNQG